MVPMCMRQQQGEGHRLLAEFGHQFATQQPEAGPAIENQDLLTSAKLEAGGIAAVL